MSRRPDIGRAEDGGSGSTGDRSELRLPALSFPNRPRPSSSSSISLLLSSSFLRSVCLLFVLFCSASFGAPVNLWFEKANGYYEQKQYDSAAAYYERIAESGLENSSVYFNLGNSYFRLSRMGPALLAYEKARRLAPTDPDIANNIKFANLNIVDKVPTPERGFLEAGIYRLHNLLPLRSQLWVLLALMLVLSLLFSGWLFASRNARLWMSYAGAMLIMLILWQGLSAAAKIYTEESTSDAIVLQSAVDAKNEPNGAKSLFTVHEGTKFRVHKSIDNWSLVSLPNGVSGWVENSALGRI